MNCIIYFKQRTEKTTLQIKDIKTVYFEIQKYDFNLKYSIGFGHFGRSCAISEKDKKNSIYGC